MPLIPEALLDEIQSRTDIVELIGRYVPLKRAGRHFKANCPFHKEQTPSFHVNTDKQIFHCFGCGVGGNVFSFLMQHDRLTFPEAARQLADQVGVRVPEETPEASSQNAARESLRTLTEKICGYFERTLRDPAQGKRARAYLAARGVSDATRDRFRLGLTPEGWDGLLRAAGKSTVTAAQLEAAGLAVRGKSGYYDRFRGRLMFPILDLRSRVVGFGGRSLDGQEPKYLNGPETPLYTKGQHLFGLSQAKDAIAKTRTAVVVEGYFDCVVLAGAGIEHVVSPLGTALTIEQGRLLKRYADRVILAFDSDAAGEQAALRGIDLLVELGLRIHVAELPPGVDPDEYLRQQGREAFEALLERSAGIFDILVQGALRRHPGGTTEDKVGAAQFVLPTIARVPDAMLRREYVRLLAERLQLDERAVTEELAKVQSPHLSSARRADILPSAKRKVGGPIHGAERVLTALLLEEPSRMRQARETLGAGWVTDPALLRVLDVIGELTAADQPATPAHVISRLADRDGAALVTELVALAQSVDARDEAFEESLRRLASRARQRELEELREQLRVAQAAGQDSDVHRLLTVIQRRLSTASVRVTSGG